MTEDNTIFCMRAKKQIEYLLSCTELDIYTFCQNGA